MISLSVIIIALSAAFLHALWNAMVKGADNRALSIGLVSLGHFVPALPFFFILPSPDSAALPYIIASTIIHWGYYYFLITAYKQGDLSVVYPIARGTAPVLIALGATIWPGEVLSVMAWGGILGVACGVCVLVFSHNAKVPFFKALLPAFITAVMVTAYSIVDGIGVRVSKAPLSYIAWLFTAEVCVAVFILLPRLSLLKSRGLGPNLIGFSGGIISSLSYGLALFAKTLAPLALVSAVRETSVILAAIIGVIGFQERPILTRFTAAIIVALGVVLIALS